MRGILIERNACVALAALLVIGGCATHSEARRSLVEHVRRGQYGNAEARVRELRLEASDKDAVMDLMDQGTVAHLQGRYRDSNQLLDAAKRQLDQLFGVQISDELEAMAWNEASKSFKGEEFERVMLCLLMAFNYLHLGSLEEAAVEARQINQRLQVYGDLLRKSNVTPHYTQDPFAQYLAGLIAESAGDTNDAFRSYEDALNGYDRNAINGVAAPVALKAALYRTARVLNYAEAVQRYAAFASLPDANPDEWQRRAHVVVIVGVGQVAHKESRSWIAVDPQGDVIKVPYPVFVRGFHYTTDVRVDTAGTPAQVDVVHEVSTLAINVLDDKNGQVKGKAVAKALARYLVKKAARAIAANTNNQVAGLAALFTSTAINVADIAETADTRSWMTLPDHYRMAVTSVDPASGQVYVRMRALAGGGLVDEQIFSLRVSVGQTRFVVLRVREGKGGLVSAPALPRDAAQFAVLPPLPPRAVVWTQPLPPQPSVTVPLADPIVQPPPAQSQVQPDNPVPSVTADSSTSVEGSPADNAHAHFENPIEGAATTSAEAERTDGAATVPTHRKEEEWKVH
jgi:uncharacterized protein